MKLSTLATAAMLATEACSATPLANTTHMRSEQNVRTAPVRVNESSGSELPHSQPEEKASGESSKKPKTYQWGLDSDKDQKRIEELSEWIAAFATSRYAECVAEACDTEKTPMDNPDSDPSANCQLTVEDEDTKEVLTDDIPGNIQRDILGKVHILLDDFKAREEAQRAKTRKAFKKLEEAIRDTLIP